MTVSTRCWRGVRPDASAGPSGSSLTLASPLVSLLAAMTASFMSGDVTVAAAAPLLQTCVRTACRGGVVRTRVTGRSRFAHSFDQVLELFEHTLYLRTCVRSNKDSSTVHHPAATQQQHGAPVRQRAPPKLSEAAGRPQVNTRSTSRDRAE